ncbi:hypothetical protein [Nocardiopsis tropica]|uniref:Uncharacterized protein n=1 Tax=Nocardiopsis tropica TaxID=109330 RepID=A0ABU7KXH6_9ACTN|nr:hypothetical protein [Nocardiopsis umidischolae]MEE2053988.1 hypothetical protein [Nocardiopsis umidischolae]
MPFMRWKWVLLLVIIAVVLASVWALPHLFPNLSLGLDELNQLAGIASLAIAVAALVSSVWALRSPSVSPDHPDTGDTANASHRNMTGSVVQDDWVKGGASNTAYEGDHIDFSGGTFYGKVVGKEEHHPQSSPLNSPNRS